MSTIGAASRIHKHYASNTPDQTDQSVNTITGSYVLQKTSSAPGPRAVAEPHRDQEAAYRAAVAAVGLSVVVPRSLANDDSAEHARAEHALTTALHTSDVREQCNELAAELVLPQRLQELMCGTSSDVSAFTLPR